MPEAIREFDAGTGGRKPGTNVRDLDCEECLANMLSRSNYPVNTGGTSKPGVRTLQFGLAIRLSVLI